MANQLSSPSCEVIILTALRVECQAVLHHLQDLQEVVHRSGTIYHQGIFPGKHFTWRVAVAEIGMGGVAAALEAEKAIDFFQARIALFVGIAGGLKDVQRGDVVAATKIYAYDSGKAAQRFEPRPELGHSSHALVQRAQAEAHSDAWLVYLGEATPSRTPQVFIGALAAGDKVLASTQSIFYRLLKNTYGDALAVEMEGHGFLHAVRVNQTVHGLVIRGIADLVDDKSVGDTAGWQRVAARHAAAFAFQILTTFTLPGWQIEPSPSLPPQSTRFGAPFPEIWNVSRRHNPFFTGRAHVLQQLSDGFRSEPALGIVPNQAITGLGGMGKTQAAAEYAYRFRADYRAVLWVRAETQENLLADFKAIAELLKRPQKHIQDQASLIKTMQDWFINESDWLLILDNADDLALVDPFIPRAIRGHLLLTTRAEALGNLAQPLRLEPLGLEDGALCILRRAAVLGWNKQLKDAPSASVDNARQLVQLMEGLPLALEQAGAYINDTGSGVRRYLKLYQQYRTEMQSQHYGPLPDYPWSVASAWKISRDIVEQTNPAAAELLRLCAFLAPEAIPDELVTIGASALGSVLGPVAGRPVALDLTISILLKYSLLKREVDRETDLTRLSIHRILQEILIDEMDMSTRKLWAQRAVRVVAQALKTTMPWPILQAHAHNCLLLIEQWNMTFSEATFLKKRVQQT